MANNAELGLKMREIRSSRSLTLNSPGEADSIDHKLYFPG